MNDFKRSCIYTILLLLIPLLNSHAQGCVAIRGNSSCAGGAGLNQLSLQKSQFELQFNGRYFKSFRHFRGDHEEKNRIEDGTEVINHSTFLDLGINYGISDRLFARLILPFVTHNRSSMYEHGGNPPNGLGERHITSSSGISDVRLGLGYWLFEATNSFNIALGLNLKLPTGSFDYTDTFYNQGENKDMNLENVVDQSIQPGDGGFAFGLDLQSFYPLRNNLVFSASAFYLLNPRETNDVLTRNGNSVFSCPDQYGARLGLFIGTQSGLNLYLGGMLEGVPAEDVLGSSAGYRRPGYVYSVDPGLAYITGNFALFLNMPVAVYRNRVQSYIDKERTASSGVYRHGDAAFADYLINFGISYRLQKTPMHHEMTDAMKEIN